MLRNKFKSLHFKHFSRSSFGFARQISSKPLLAEDQHYAASSGTSSRDYFEEKMKAMLQQQQELSAPDSITSIYRVPEKLRHIQPRAYAPQFISIGPYHRNLLELQASEKLKWLSMYSLVGLGEQSRGKLESLVAGLKKMEHEARKYYSEDVRLSKDEFVSMMLLDGCFIVELFKQLNEKKFASSTTTLLPKRWMLPAVRRDLITVENQLPMIVLEKIFDETRTKSMEETSLVLHLNLFY